MCIFFKVLNLKSAAPLPFIIDGAEWHIFSTDSDGSKTKQVNFGSLTFTPKSFFNYYKDCYKLDNKEFVVDNLLGNKYPYKWFVHKKEELLSEGVPITPYINKYIEKLERDIEIYKLEKKLFYACFFVLGQNNNPLVKDKRICAPLVLFPSEIKTVDGEKYLSIEIDSFELNRSAFQYLQLKPEFNTDQLIDALFGLFEQGESDLIQLKRTLDKYLIDTDTAELPLFPQVWNEKRLKEYFKANKTNKTHAAVVPAAGTVLVNKTDSSLRVLHDLEEMAVKSIFNSSIANLFSTTSHDFNPADSVYKFRLNEAQFSALNNAHQYSNSLIIGPPGTGKSYTIATIVADALLKNQSVLLVAKTKQAVEVLRGMLQTDFDLKNYLIHTTGTHHKISLKSKVKKFLSGISEKQQSARLDGKLEKHFRQLQRLELDFERAVAQELKLGAFNIADDKSILEQFEHLWLKFTYFNDQKIWQLFEQIQIELQELNREISTFSKRKIQHNIAKNSNKYRFDITTFYGALEADSFTRYKEILARVNHRNVLKVFPIWLANLSDLNTVLPLESDIFDLVIIDEATQCNMAMALPALYRAKRAVVVGDPNQLRHYSFVSGAQQEALRKAYQLPPDAIFDYRKRSVLDLFISKVHTQNQVTFLREHFRSTPDIIGFSNKKFYENQLEILKATPKHIAQAQIQIIQTKGVRDDTGINKIEAKQVIVHLKALIEKYATAANPPTIGIISPFSTQVRYLNQLLREQPELQAIKRHEVLCGTPYHFQGNEREIVLISFCVSPKSHHAAFMHINTPEVLNVAITRAKSEQYLFLSVTENEMPHDSLLREYIRFARKESKAPQIANTHDMFQKDVVAALQEHNAGTVYQSFPLAGNVLDILVTVNENNYFIDLVGYPGAFADAFSLERYKTLARVGVKSLPLHHTIWREQRTIALNRLLSFLKS